MMFYVYEHWRPDTDMCFYVGKGRGVRANMMARRNKHHKAIQNKLHGLGMAVEVRIIQSGLTEREAFDLEVKRIAMWKNLGVKLANKTNGGEGVSGLVFSLEHRQKLSAANIGRKMPPMSESQKKKISERMKGKKIRLGATLSKETKEKISKSHMGLSYLKGIKKSEEHRKKLSISVSNAIKGENNPFWGRKHSEETKRKISETKKKRVANAAC